MTSETLSNQSSNHNQDFNKLINVKLLLNNIRQNKVLIIMTGIILFFAKPLVQIISLMAYYNSYTSETLDSYAENLARNSGSVVTAAALILAIVIALNVTSYMHNRKAAIFYNSIPIERLHLFATQYLSGLAYFIPVFAFSYILSIIIMPFRNAIAINTEYYLGALFFFLLIYSFIILCANIGGTYLNSLLAAGFLCAVLPSVFYVFFAFVESFYRFTSVYGITDSPFWEFIYYPIIIYFPQVFVAHENLTALNCIFMLIFAAGMTCLAYLFSRLTKTENAEKPFYFEKFLSVFKYSVLTLLIILSGIIFYMWSNSSFLFLIIGIAFGGFLAFLLVNLIIYKNMRKVFKGIKQFLILAVCTGLIAGVVSADIFGIDKYIPEASKVDEIYYEQWNYNCSYDFSYELNGFINSDYYRNYYNRNTITLKDPETIQLVNDIFTSALKSERSSSSMYMSNVNFGIDPLASYNGAISYKLKNGGTWAKKIYLYNLNFTNKQDLDEFQNAVSKLRKSHGFKQAYYYPITDTNVMREQMDYAGNFGIMLMNDDKVVLDRDLSRGEMETLISVLNEDIKTTNLNENWYYNLTLKFKRSDGNTGYVNISMNDFDFEKTIDFLYDNYMN